MDKPIMDIRNVLGFTFRMAEKAENDGDNAKFLRWGRMWLATLTVRDFLEHNETCDPRSLDERLEEAMTGDDDIIGVAMWG